MRREVPRRRTDEEIVRLIETRLVKTTGFALAGHAPKTEHDKGIHDALEAVIALIKWDRP